MRQSVVGSLCLGCQRWSIERRIELLGAERIVRTLGIDIVCVSLGFMATCLLAVFVAPLKLKMDGANLLGWAALFLIPAAFLGYGIAMARARTRRRWPAVLASVGMLPLVPIGTFVGVASLGLLMTRRVRNVFGKEHQEIIRSTPGVRLGLPFGLLAAAAVMIWPFAFLAFVVVYNLAMPVPH